MRTGDRWLCAIVLLCSLGCLLLRPLFRREGAYAVLTTPAKTYTLSLSEEATLTVTGKDHTVVTVTVADGAVRFSNSTCPDRVCVHSGALRHTGDCAACVPAGITLRVAGSSGEVDAVAK